MSDKVLITFHVSPGEHKLLTLLQGNNRSVYLRCLIHQDALQRGLDLPDDLLQDTRGIYPREGFRRANFKSIITSMHYRMKKNDLPMSITDSDLEFCVKYWNDRCAACGEPHPGTPNGLVFDHWIPIGHSSCPGSVPENIVPLCTSCNKKKGSMLPDQWIAKYHPNEGDQIRDAVDRYFSVVLSR